MCTAEDSVYFDTVTNLHSTECLTLWNISIYGDSCTKCSFCNDSLSVVLPKTLQRTGLNTYFMVRYQIYKLNAKLTTVQLCFLFERPQILSSLFHQLN